MGATVLGYHRFRRSDAVDIIFSLVSLLFFLGMLVLFVPAVQRGESLFRNNIDKIMFH